MSLPTLEARLALLGLILFVLFTLAAPLVADGVDHFREYRYCGEPARLANGEIRRRADVLRVFRQRYECPATGLQTGPCPGWAIDHVIPLAVGGCDAVSNLQWLPDEIKSCSGRFCKDRWERRVYIPATP